MRSAYMQVSDGDLYGLETWLNLDEATRQSELFMVTDQQNVSGLAELQRRIVRFVHTQNLDGAAVKLSSLNRRYGKLCRTKAGGSLFNVLSPLVGSVLRMHQMHGATLVGTVKHWNEWNAFLEAQFDFEADPEVRAALIQRAVDGFWSNAR